MIIGLCGPEGAGKTTAGSILSAHLGVPVRPFAGPLKAMLGALGVPFANLHGTPEEKAEPLEILGGKSARYALQRLGTEWGRNLISPDIWANAWMMSAPNAGCIADDLRFENEQKVIKGLGGRVICVVRSLDDFDRIPRHASEDFAAIERDAIVLNDGDLDQFRGRLINAIRGISIADRILQRTPRYGSPRSTQSALAKPGRL